MTTRVGPRLPRRGPDDQQIAAAASRLNIPAAGDTTAITRYLHDLIGRCPDPVPLVDELTAADIGTPRCTASIARAALSVLRSKDPEIIRADVERELAEIDLLCQWRVRMAGLDVHGDGDIDWMRIHEVVTARAEYRQRWGVAC